MVFSSLTFLLLFLPTLLFFYFIVKSDRWRNGVLLCASLLFYGWGEPVWILAMIFSTAVNYYCAILLDRTDSPGARKGFLTLGAAISLGFLFYFKYAAFTVATVAGLFRLKVAVPEIRLPIGISFYTFQVLTYTVDVYRGKARVQRSFARLLLYVSCFPQLIAGPIVQYSDVMDRLGHRRTTVSGFIEGFRRFVRGLFKKVILANISGLMLERTALAGTGAELSLLGAWVSAFLYTLQIYYDFSAYSDMAIGMGRILGFSYKENFDHPYASLSVTEFWRRWHISLGSFFRDYVYFPLGGNRRGAARTALNLMIVWMLTGLWHGASWNFVVWGLYYGVLLLIERFVLAGVLPKTPKAVRWLLTFLLVVVGWVIFYYTDLSAVKQHLLAMIGLGVRGGALRRLPLVDRKLLDVLRIYTVLPLLFFIPTLPVRPALEARLGRTRLSEAAVNTATAALLAVSVVFLIGQSYNPFIYFRF
ncbi:MAG: MBOAT family protein [Oscillospiraceae bacterium]|nr:MBOAT family protein [Oscillospiraceae bacterium]